MVVSHFSFRRKVPTVSTRSRVHGIRTTVVCEVSQRRPGCGEPSLGVQITIRSLK